MRGLLLVLTFGLALMFSGLKAWADNDDEYCRRPHVNADAMSLFGLAAASVVGTCAYLARRSKYLR
jgi:hypothetical protein